MGAQTNFEDLETRSGMRPMKSSLKYEITTADVQDYLQKKLNVIVKASEGNGIHIGDTRIIVSTHEASRRYFPFVVALSSNVIQENNNGRNNQVEEFFLDMDDNDGDGRAIKFKQPIYKLLQLFAYNKKDINYFFKSNEGRKDLNISREVANQLIKKTRPIVKSYSSNSKREKDDYVIMLLDPMRIFHDMLIFNNDRDNNFSLTVESYKKFSDGLGKYTIVRSINKNNKKSRHTGDELASRIFSSKR